MDFYSIKKMPYQCIEHMGNKLTPSEKLQMYCDIAAHFNCIDLKKLRLFLGIIFTQRNYAEGHYIGEICKEDFEKMIDECLLHTHEVQACEHLPAAYGIDIKLNECYLCPYSSSYKNMYINEEKDILQHIYNCDNTTGTITPSVPYLNIVSNSKLELNSLVEIKTDDSPDNGICVPLASIFLAAAASWLGCDKTDWFIDNVLIIQLKNKIVNTLYPSPSITRHMTEGEVLKCVELFKQTIIESTLHSDIDAFKKIVTVLKKKQSKNYVPSFDDCMNKHHSKKKNSASEATNTKSTSDSVSANEKNIVDYSTLLLGECDEDVKHIPYSSITISEQAISKKSKSATSKDSTTCYNSEIDSSHKQEFVDGSVTNNTESCYESMPVITMNKTTSDKNIKSYMSRIENPLECINIICNKDFFSADELIIINEANSKIEELTVLKELALRKFFVCDAVTMNDSLGLLLYLDSNTERNFKARFYFFRLNVIYDKLFSALVNTNILKLTLSPFALQSMLSTNCMCQNTVSLCDIYTLHNADAPTLKKLVDGKGDGDHLVRTYKYLYSMCSQYLDNKKIKSISSYHAAIAMSFDINKFVSDASIDYDGYTLRYNYDDRLSNTLIPGIIFSITNIELDIHCEVGIPEITRTIIAKLFNGRYIYDEKIKILSETSNGLSVYIPSDKDSYSVIDVINRITIKTIRELTKCKPVYTIYIHS